MWPRGGCATLRGSICPEAICTASYPSLSMERTWVTTLDPACTTVTGTSFPFSSQTWVIPTLVPSTPDTARRSEERRVGKECRAGGEPEQVNGREDGRKDTH